MSTSYHNKPPADNTQFAPDMLRAALWYARSGIHVLPLHSIGDHGQCTCGKPDCKYTGKHPRTNKGVWDATTDPAQIRRWWRQWPNANIGISCGPSGLIILDLDEYKRAYAGDGLLGDADLDTVTVITGGGGRHVWYRAPAGERLGNRTGNLPAGIDVRGHGGYVVAAPSLHVSGNRYSFLEGHEHTRHAIAPLPAWLADLLRAAQADDVHVTLPAPGPQAPDLAQWDLPAGIFDAILTPHATRGGRSDTDYAIAAALVRAGATDDDIAQVFYHYPTSGKYSDRCRRSQRGGADYLARTIAAARRSATHDPPDPQITPRLQALRTWAHGPDAAEEMRAAGIERIADLRKTVDALLEHALRKRTPRAVLSTRQLGELVNAGHVTVWRHVQRLAGGLTVKRNGEKVLLPGLEWVRIASTENGLFTIDLAPLLERDLSETLCTPYVGSSVSARTVSLGSPLVGQGPSPSTFYADHRPDDAFVSYPRSHAAKRRRCSPDDLLPSLTASCLTVAAHLEAHAGATVKSIAGATGLTVSAIRVALRRLREHGLLVIWAEGRRHAYDLHPDHEERLDDLRPDLASYGLGILRQLRDANARAAYAATCLRWKPDERTAAKLKARRDENDAIAEQWAAQLEGMGIDWKVKVRPGRPRQRLHHDAAARWESLGSLWDTWRALGEDLDRDGKERLITLGIAGEDADDERYRKVRAHVRELVDELLSLAHRRHRFMRRPAPDPVDAPAPVFDERPGLFAQAVTA